MENRGVYTVKRRMRYLMSREESGFSLFEMALLLAILGLFVASFLQIYRMTAKERFISDTGYRGAAIAAALDKFMAENQRMPCPADPSLPANDVNAGVEQCLTSQALGTCSGGGDKGVCRVVGQRDQDDLNGNGVIDGSYGEAESESPANMTVENVYLGAVPYVTLNIPMEDTLDGWGHKFRYATSQNLTVMASETDASTYSPIRGVISTINDVGSPVTRTMLGKLVPFAVPYVVISYGENGVGGYNVSGLQEKPCSGASIGKDIENCDTDSIFYEVDQRSYVAGSGYYDDRLLASVIGKGGTDRWRYSETSTNNIYNTATASVGIGTDIPAQKLDVNGSIRAQQAYGVNNFCNAAGTNCFPAQMIGGTGVSCSNGAVSGIKNANVDCVAKVDPSGMTPGTCLPGQYVTGFDASGNITCAYP